MNKLAVGVLALQGDFELHQKSLRKLGVHAPLVRTKEELDACRGLIIPGGESTTLIKLLNKTGMPEAVKKFSEDRPVFGTCAGCIAMATRITNDTMTPMGLIDMDVERNAYGRQVDSFVDTVQIPMFDSRPGFEGIFIRAPKILSVGGETEILAYHRDEIVMARNKRVLVATFHPELTGDTRIHRFFLEAFFASA